MMLRAAPSLSLPLLALSLAAAPALAQSTPAPEAARALLPPPARSLSLADAIAYARAHQPAVLAGIARVAAQKEAAKVPGSQWLPQVGASAQLYATTANNTTGTYVNVPSLDIPRIGATRTDASGSWQPYASTFAGVGAAQEAFDFGRIAAETAAADALVDVQKQSSANALLDVTYGVVEAYFAVYAAKGVLKASEDAFARSKVHRDLAKAGVNSGMRPPIELTRAEAELARFDAGRIKAEGGVAEAEAVYAAAVGVPDAALDVGGVPVQPLDVPALDDAVRQASARDPRILGALAEVRAQEEQTRAIGALARPDFSLTGTLSGRAGGAPPSSGTPANGDGWIPNVPNWDVGVVFSWPLFDPTVRARADASRAEEQVRREELAQARFEEAANIRRAYVGVVVARRALPALQQALDSAKANWAQADARFRGGLGTAVELADAEGVLADAEIALALGMFDVARSRALFGRAIAEVI
ncbi:MAG TPA: TolC family protein [Polyangiaceae bacterium]|jgi:outer membrane protein TolC